MQDDKDFTKKVVKAYLFFKKNPNALKRGSVAESLFNLINQGDIKIEKEGKLEPSLNIN